MDHWRKLERQFVSRAFRLALPNAGKSSPAKMAMMAMTTRSSMSVKAHLLTGREPLATGEIPFTGFAFELVRISETASPRPVGCQAKMAVSEDKTRICVRTPRPVGDKEERSGRSSRRVKRFTDAHNGFLRFRKRIVFAMMRL